MARFVRNDIVVLPFPFSAASGSKRRPALVLASWEYGRHTDYLVCVITSQSGNDPNSIPILASDTTAGRLQRASYLRPAYLFASDESLIEYKLGELSTARVREVIAAILAMLNGEGKRANV